MPFGSLSALRPALSIRASSGLDPEWGQVLRLAARFYQPLLIVGPVQPILVLYLIGPGGLKHRGTVAPPGVRKPILTSPWEGKRIRGGGGRCRGSCLEDEGPPSKPEDHGFWGGGAPADRSIGLEHTSERAPAWLRASAWGVPALTEWGGALADCPAAWTSPTDRKTSWGWPEGSNLEAKLLNRRDKASWSASG